MANEITNAFRTAFRNYVTDGVQSSGVNNPRKSELRDLGVVIQTDVDTANETAAAALTAAQIGLKPTIGSVRVLTTTDVAVATALENGDTLDGVVLATGDRVAKAYNGTTGAADNGVYIVQASGAAVRASDADSDTELRNATFAVDAGTYQGEIWGIGNTAAITVDTTAIVVKKIRAATGYEGELIAARGGRDEVGDRLDVDQDIALDTLAAVATRQAIGTTETPATGTALSAFTYVMDPVLTVGDRITGIVGWARNTGTLTVKRFTKSGDDFTQVGSDYPVAIGATGAFSLKPSDFGHIPCVAGEYLGFYNGDSIIDRNAAGTPKTGIYSNGALSNASSFTDASLDSTNRIELRFVVEKATVTEARVATLETNYTALFQSLLQVLNASGLMAPPVIFFTRRGAWYDFADSTSLYTDTAGTTPVSADGDPIGYVRDKSGYGYHYAAESDALRGVYKTGIVGARSVGRFDATQYLSGVKKDMTNARSKVTVISVAKFDSASGDQAIIEHMTGGSSLSARLWHGNVLATISGSRMGSVARRADGDSASVALSFRIADTDFVIQETVADYGNGKLHLFTDGYSSPEGQVAFVGSGTSHASNESASYIGGSVPASDAFAGDICEIIEIVGDITDEERSGLYAYLAAKWGGLPVGDLEFYDPTGPLPTIWLWFNGPRAIEYDTDKFILGGVASGGSVMVADYDYTGALAIAHKVLHPRWQLDDHIAPALLELPDGNILAAFTRHGLGDGTYYVTKTTTPGDISSFAAVTDIKAQLFPDLISSYRFSYANLAYLSGEGASGRIYLILRLENLSTGDEDWGYSTSDDDGDTWTAVQKLWGPDRPYTKVWSNGVDRIDFLFNDGHPGSYVFNNTYHVYYTGGSFYETDGTLIGNIAALPVDFADATKVYDASVGGLGRSWVWDLIRAPTTNYPVGCIAIFTPNAPTFHDHRYHQLRWNGSAWSRHEICAAGGHLISGQPAYSGGVITDPADINVVYCSRQVDEAEVISLTGTFQIFKYVTADGGTTWTGTQLTTGTKNKFRPFIPHNGARKLFYIEGEYPGPQYYDPWHTEVAVLDIT